MVESLLAESDPAAPNHAPDDALGSAIPTADPIQPLQPDLSDLSDQDVDSLLSQLLAEEES